MLALPKKGFSRSKTAHNVDLAVCCDWLEASVLFAQEPVSGSDIVDVLRENEIYADQNFAWELVYNAFAGLEDRARLMGDGYPLAVQGGPRLVARGDWRDYSAYSFCLILSLPSAYPDWARSFGTDFTAQGELFEALTSESVAASLSGWTVHPTGWTKARPSQLADIVTDVAAKLGEATGDLFRWTKDKAKEAGLDILCFRPFPDGRVGVPVYMVQCASGNDWKGKLKTPDLRIWTKVITFASDPKKAFSMPFALDSADFIYSANVVDGLLFDRHRLLAPGLNLRDWLPAALKGQLVAWLEPRIAALPAME
jgi:hypothetical protein